MNARELAISHHLIEISVTHGTVSILIFMPFAKNKVKLLAANGSSGVHITMIFQEVPDNIITVIHLLPRMYRLWGAGRPIYFHAV